MFLIWINVIPVYITMIIMIMTTLFITIFHAKDGDFFHLITIDTTTTHMHIKQRDGRRACFTHNFSVPSPSSQLITVTLREVESTLITVTVLPSFLILIISLTLLQHHTVISIVCSYVNSTFQIKPLQALRWTKWRSRTFLALINCDSQTCSIDIPLICTVTGSLSYNNQSESAVFHSEPAIKLFQIA